MHPSWHLPPQMETPTSQAIWVSIWPLIEAILAYFGDHI